MDMPTSSVGLKISQSEERTESTVVMDRVSVPWSKFSEMRDRLVSAMHNISLQNSDELYISVKNSKNGLVLTFQNYEDSDTRKNSFVADVASQSDKSSSSPDTTDREKIKEKHNYLNVIDVFLLPEYRDQSVQCNLETYENTAEGRFISSMYFHPFHLKLGRHVKCIQCKLHGTPKPTSE